MRSRHVRLPLVVLSGGLMLLAGCETTGSLNVAADDACRAERTDLKSFQDYFFQAIVEGAATGAVVGGLSGLLFGGSTQSTLIGAGAGAVAGGLGGYFLAKQKANSSTPALAQSVFQDINTENTQIDRVTYSFRRLSDCRFRSAQMVKSDYAAGRITQPEAEAKLKQIRVLFNEDVTYAESLGAKMTERGAQYQTASDEMLKLDPNAKQVLATRQAQAGPAATAAPPREYTVDSAARVRSQPSTSGGQVATLNPGELVTATDDSAAGEWMHVKLSDGRTGYIVSRLLRPPGTPPKPAPVAVAAAPPPPDVAGVAQLTETNQLKRKALTDDVQQAKLAANNAFDLQGSISEAPDADRLGALAV